MNNVLYNVLLASIIIVALVFGICVGAAVSAQAEVIEEVPGVVFLNRENPTPTNVVYTNHNGEIVSEIFDAPETIVKNGPVPYVFESTTDPGRIVDNLPDYPIARWHWWLFGFVLLPTAQKQYAECVGKIKAYQELLGETPLIDGEGSIWKATIESIREYLVPFDAIQRPSWHPRDVPPTLQDAKDHVVAAIIGYNNTVYHTGLCHYTAAYYKSLVVERIR